jgi:serine O-acetyltransferase
MSAESERDSGAPGVSRERLQQLKQRVNRLWLLSPERLWLASIALQRRGHWMLAFWLKQVNTMLYHNSLGPGASVAPDIHLGHHSIGIVVTNNVTIGEHVKIWHNVTLTAGRAARARADGPSAGAEAGPRSRIIVEDGAKIGANAVVIAPRGRTLRIGRGARVGAGTVLTQDLPAGATAVGAPVRVLEKDPPSAVPAQELAQPQR